MKTKLYIFNESCFGGLYGIGTYINQIISFFSRNEEVETHIFNIRYNCKEVIISAQLQISVAYFCSIGLYFLV